MLFAVFPWSFVLLTLWPFEDSVAAFQAIDVASLVLSLVCPNKVVAFFAMKMTFFVPVSGICVTGVLPCEGAETLSLMIYPVSVIQVFSLGEFNTITVIHVVLPVSFVHGPIRVDDSTLSMVHPIFPVSVVKVEGLLLGLENFPFACVVWQFFE